MDENDKIRERIQLLLEQKGLRVADVVKEAKVSHSGLREFLIGKNQTISVSFLSKICAVLGVTVADLLADTPPTPITLSKPEEMAKLMHDLSSEEQEKALDIVRALKYGYERNKKVS